MKRFSSFVAIAAFGILAACTVAPPPAVIPSGDARFLVDPRIGYNGPVPAGADQRFESAWRYFLAGNEPETTRLGSELRKRHADYAPAVLLDAAVMIREKRLDEAAAVLEPILKQQPTYTAARIYDAEIALARGDVRGALTRYRNLGNNLNVPSVVAERVASLESSLYASLLADASAATGETRVALLREVLALRPAEQEPRISLAQTLASMKRYEDARAAIDPLLDTAAVDRPEIQSILADVDVSRGRYQEAIVRLDRLARRTGDAAYSKRLEEVKGLWNRANMPPQYTRAHTAEQLTRGDLAVLAYWEVKPVRFAQNLASPPIAVDLTDASGRDEIVRAIALGLYDVDAVTRRVSPGRTVTSAGLARFTARVLTALGTPCARVAPEGNETARALRILSACGVTDAVFTADSETAVSGADAARVLEQVDRLLSK